MLDMDLHPDLVSDGYQVKYSRWTKEQKSVMVMRQHECAIASLREAFVGLEIMEILIKLSMDTKPAGWTSTNAVSNIFCPT